MCDLVALYRTVQYGFSTFTVNCGKDFGHLLLLLTLQRQFLSTIIFFVFEKFSSSF